MAQETLNRIREAELNAKQIINDAKDTQAKLLADAKAEAKQYKDSLLKKVRGDAQKRLEEAQAQDIEALQAAQERAQAVVSQYEKKLNAKMQDAVNAVIDYII